VFPFGYGLSYSTFSYDFLELGDSLQQTAVWASMSKAWAISHDMADHSSAPFISYTANVTNTGPVLSDTSVLLFVNSTVPDSPMQRLIGYTHLRALRPGESRTVEFRCVLVIPATGGRCR
jgi:hypothetical protein